MTTVRLIFSILNEKDPEKRRKLTKKLSKKERKDLLDICLGAITSNGCSIADLQPPPKKKNDPDDGGDGE